MAIYIIRFMAGGPLTQTKHFQVSRILTERITHMTAGELVPKVAELMQEFSASQATIMAALNRLRRQGIIERPLGRRRLIVAARSRPPVARVALIRPLWSTPDYDALMNAIYHAGHAAHFEFHAYVFADVVALNLLRAIEAEDDAAIITGVVNPPLHLVKAFNATRRPLVFMRDKPAEVEGSHIWVDDRKIGVLATEHLLGLGHRRIAALLSEPVNPSSSQRLGGWRDAMAAAGERNFDQLVIDCSVNVGEDAISGSYGRLAEWMKQPRSEYTAMFCVSWTGALAAMRALRENGRVIPADVSLITYGSEGAFSAFLNPPLTTVRTDVNEHARLAVQLIKQALTHENWEPETVLIEPTVIERESTGRLQS